MAVIKSAWRQPTNTSANEKGGIHDDDTAQKLGFDGGTVAGSLHMEQFPPLMVEYFGQDWWRRGNLSLYFKKATFDGDPVRAFLEGESATRAKVWMENEAGDLVMSGTAALGEDPASEIQTRLQSVRTPTDIRMLSNVVPDKPSPVLTAKADDAAIEERLQVITEPMSLYTENAEDNKTWGGRVLPIAPFVHLFRGVEIEIAPINGDYVGLYGAIEVQYLNGPVVSNTEYQLNGHALAVSESPKTEVLWYEATLSNPKSNEPVARMIKMDRLMKDASPLWQTERQKEG